MTESSSLPDRESPSSTLSARLRELGAFLSAPSSGGLTEQQRALSLGVARRLVVDAARRVDPAIDTGRLWDAWLANGIPGAERIAALCFGRGEEHRWRDQSARRAGRLPVKDAGTDAIADPAAIVNDAPTPLERAELALRIADRRRFDARGNPAVAIADLDPDILSGLMLDIAAWRLLDGAEGAEDAAMAKALGDAVRAALADQAREEGIDAAGAALHSLLAGEGRVTDAAADAIERHDWPTLAALAAAAHRRRHDAMMLALLTAEAASLPALLAPLRLDHAALAPLEASLAMLPARAVGGDGTP